MELVIAVSMDISTHTNTDINTPTNITTDIPMDTVKKVNNHLHKN